MAEHVNHAPAVTLARQPVGELGLGHIGVAAVALAHLGPGVSLGGAEEGVQLGGIEATGRIEVTGLPLGLVVLDRGVAAGAAQPLADGRLELLLVGVDHAASPGMSSSPVTAAVMSACRRS